MTDQQRDAAWGAWAPVVAAQDEADGLDLSPEGMAEWERLTLEYERETGLARNETWGG